MLAGVLGAPEEAKLELVFVVGVSCSLLAVGMTTLGGGEGSEGEWGGVGGRTQCSSQKSKHSCGLKKFVYLRAVEHHSSTLQLKQWDVREDRKLGN